MVSLYSLSLISSSILVLLSLVFLFQTLGDFSQSFHWKNFDSIPRTLVFVILAGAFSLPFVYSLTFLIVTRRSSSRMKILHRLTTFTSHSPDLILAVFFLVAFGSGNLSVVLTMMLIFTHRLTRRWVHLSSQVSQPQVDALLSLGGRFSDILFHLYLKPYFKLYCYHFVAVGCSLFVIVSPFLCLQRLSEPNRVLFPVHFFETLGSHSLELSSIALFILIVHLIRTWLDFQTDYQGVEYG